MSSVVGSDIAKTSSSEAETETTHGGINQINSNRNNASASASAAVENTSSSEKSKKKRQRRKKKNADSQTAAAAALSPPQMSRVWVEDPAWNTAHAKIIAAGWTNNDTTQRPDSHADHDHDNDNDAGVASLVDPQIKALLDDAFVFATDSVPKKKTAAAARANSAWDAPISGVQFLPSIDVDRNAALSASSGGTTSNLGYWATMVFDKSGINNARAKLEELD
ncbi:hypothetical protein HK100_002306 [Physocladia obscura]|uniref:Uncharacterized protein n=1 Tax=Physocladia obscura TaxID=109957 RepID=A0AAD5SVL5_9FUNG|nr:hypothetical protein HK100_002306 [Physocladia obscura]